MAESKNYNNHDGKHKSIVDEISDTSARAYLDHHVAAEVSIADTRKFMRENSKLGRLVIFFSGKIAKLGFSVQEAYALGLMHGLGLAERKRQEDEWNERLKPQIDDAMTIAIDNQSLKHDVKPNDPLPALQPPVD